MEEEDRELTMEDRKNATYIPEIIYHVGVSWDHIILYTYIMYFIGTEGHCRVSLREMKEKSRMPMTKIIAGKKVLSQKFDELGGLPFITIEERFSDDGKQIEDEIFVTNIDEANRSWCKENIEKLKSRGFKL